MADKVLVKNGAVLKTGSKILYNIAATGETWVINETIDSNEVTGKINFESNGFTFNRFDVSSLGRIIVYHSTISSKLVEVYFRGNWTDTAYRTVTFETSPTGDFLTWLQANAVKQ